MSDTGREKALWTPTVAAEPPRRPGAGTIGDLLPNCGPVVAEEPSMHTLEQADSWYRARAAAAYMSATRGKLAWLLALDSFVVATLAASGYPVQRVVALGATFVVSIAVFLRWAHVARGRRPPLASTLAETLRNGSRFLMLLLGLALTGGLRSPLLPTALLPLSDLIIHRGWERTARNVLGFVGATLI